MMKTRSHPQTLVLMAAAAALGLATTSRSHAQSLNTVTFGADNYLQISANTDFNISVYDGKAGYAGTGGTYGSVSGTFGDGTVEAYSFFHNVSAGSPGSIASYASNSAGITYNWSGVANFANFDRGDVWTTNDPGTSFAGGAAANYGGAFETISGGYLVNGTIDIAAFTSGTVYVLCGGYDNPFQVDLTMSGTGQPDITAGSGSIDPGTNRNMYIVAFSFDNASASYETIHYAYTGSAGNRSRFMGVVVDAERSPGPVAVSPVADVVVPGPAVDLTWINDTPNTGTVVWTDVWLGTAPGALVKVADAAAGISTLNVSLPTAGTYYWRVENYLEGSPSGTPVASEINSFVVVDSDGDGLPDSYEQIYSGTPQGMDASADDDAGGPDGLTNLQEYNLGTDPTKSDTDADGLNDGSENGAGTNPTNPDSDGDGLLDGGSITIDSGDPRYDDWAAAGIVYSENAGQRSFRGETAMGTVPTDADSDDDGLKDGVESNDDIFVDAGATGTDPADPDSDGDGAGDWYEVAASFTDPNLASDKPNVPYPLPAPDAIGDGPVKVYIMSGQSNMVGAGEITGTEPGTLVTVTGTENKFPHLLAEGGGWTSRADVYYRGVVTATGKGPLAPDVWSSRFFGPELGFGLVMGYHHQEPVLLLKSSQGNRSIGFDFLPPGSTEYEWEDGNTYAGYGDPWRLFLTGGSPAVAKWFAGKQYDDCFLSEEDMGPDAWVDATAYPAPSWASRGGKVYQCTSAHTSSPATEPGAGSSWQTFWKVYSIFNAADVLDDFANQYPDWASRGFEIAGFVWWQGDADRYRLNYAKRHEQNLVNLINSLRSDFERRYPGKGAADAPFVLATLGQTALDSTDEAEKAILDAQLAVDGESGNHAQFAGNVKTVYSHPLSRGGASNSHYNGHAETYLLVGDALGRAMVDLLEGGGTVSDYDSWAGGYLPTDIGLSGEDYDGDGLSNNEERLWGLDPTSSSSVSPTSAPLDAAAGTFSYTRRKTGLSGASYSYEYSTTLKGGSWIPFTPANESSDLGTPVEEVTITLPASLLPSNQTKLFVRVVVN